MYICHGLNEYRSAVNSGALSVRASAVTLGKFDGVHLGHQKLLREVLKRQDEGCAGIMFAIDARDDEILTEEERAGFVSGLGIDILIECPFTKTLMTMKPETFLSEILKDTLRASYVIVGTDYRFGYRREGDADTLRSLQERYGYQASIVEKERYLGEEISSTRVRTAVASGDMELTEALLGRPYPVWGTVVHGRHLGSSIGFPTANILPDRHKLLPPDGVYASLSVLEDGRTIPGITNIGTNPTVAAGNVRTIETNLIDFSEDIYGQPIHTQLLRRLRGERTFPSVQVLAAQMTRDREIAGELLTRRHDRETAGELLTRRHDRETAGELLTRRRDRETAGEPLTGRPDRQT